MVDGARPNEAAIERIERPATMLREISSRSANDKAEHERTRGGGRIPPLSDRIRCIEEWPRSKDRAISFSDSPCRHRSHIIAF
jgi:hypothetical protein